MEINNISIGVATCIITDRAKNNEIKHASILHNLIHVKIKIQLNNNLSDNYIYMSIYFLVYGRPICIRDRLVLWSIKGLQKDNLDTKQTL